MNTSEAYLITLLAIYPGYEEREKRLKLGLKTKKKGGKSVTKKSY